MGNPFVVCFVQSVSVFLDGPMDQSFRNPTSEGKSARARFLEAREFVEVWTGFEVFATLVLVEGKWDTPNLQTTNRDHQEGS